jgi:hypothetical protein
MNALLYANTADPGPALSSHWPNGQSSPKPCNTTAKPGSNTPECHYDYGWNAATNSYQDAVNAYVSLGWAANGSTRTPVANQWWLDVETANSWTSTPSLNVDALQGEADYLSSVGAASVGFYASSSDWQTVTAGTTVFAADPSWVAGASSLSDAQSRCGGTGFTGGAVALVQYPSSGFDGDYRCGTQPSIAFATAPQTLTAGFASGQMSVELAQPAAASTVINITSSSSVGGFSTSSSGPWSSSLTLTIATATSSSGNFFYRDTRAGSPTLTASASGYGPATQTETVTAAALAAITVSPASANVRVGASQQFTATGGDQYGNTVSMTPSWSVSPALGTFSLNPGNPTNFTAATIGTGTVSASFNGVTGTASVSVLAKKRHAGVATSGTKSQQAATSVSLHVRPRLTTPNGRVRVYGSAGSCKSGNTVFVLSHVFAGRSFAGLGAIRTRARAGGAFSAFARVRRNAGRGQYAVSARCGGKLVAKTTLEIK